eukprot:scaffold69829_cov69-Phaeocystis_antarctica.AAC.10
MQCICRVPAAHADARARPARGPSCRERRRWQRSTDGGGAAARNAAAAWPRGGTPTSRASSDHGSRLAQAQTVQHGARLRGWCTRRALGGVVSLSTTVTSTAKPMSLRDDSTWTRAALSEKKITDAQRAGGRQYSKRDDNTPVPTDQAWHDLLGGLCKLAAEVANGSREFSLMLGVVGEGDTSSRVRTAARSRVHSARR